jgi:hypothetical protein
MKPNTPAAPVDLRATIDPEAAARPPRWPAVAMALGLVVFTFAAHWGALSDGVDFDDYLHRANVRTSGWSWHDLIDATTVAFPDRTMSYWWQTHPTECRYVRPVFTLVLKAEYALGRGNPVVIDACSIAWHAAAVLLVFQFAAWLLGSRAWALLAAVLFALCPPSVFTVSWTAALNALLGTLFLVAATSAYARASFDAARRPCPLRPGLLALSVLCWLLSVFSREAGIAFPVLAVVLDAAVGGWRHLRHRWRVHVLLCGLAGCYVVWRLCIFQSPPQPPGYLETPHDAGYVLWAGAKLLQLLFCVLAQRSLAAVIRPEDTWTTAMVWTHVGMLAILTITIAWYARLTRRQPGRWFGPLWMVAALVPGLPVSTMPHFGYLPAVGYALAAGFFVRGVPRAWRGVILGGAVLLAVVHFAGHRTLWRANFRAEQLIYADILDHTPPPPRGSHLFFVNFPLTSTMTIYALEEQWGARDLAGHLLTLNPGGLRMERPTRVERVAANELLVESDPPGFFVAPAEHLFLDMTAGPREFTVGQIVPGELFDTTILAVGADGGVLALKFTFREPLDSPEYYFYVSTPDRPAYRLRFGPSFTAEALAAETATWRVRRADMLAERDRVLFGPWWRPRTVPASQPAKKPG